MKPSRVMRRLLEEFSRPFVRGTVLAAYRDPDGAARRRIRKAAAIGYGLAAASPGRRRRARMFLDFVHQVQERLFREGVRIDLGTAPLGFEDLRIHCRSGDVNSSIVYLYGFSDNLSYFRLYRRCLQEGEAALDVGANLGMHALALSRCVGRSGRVLAFEPDREIVTRLNQNLRLNRVENVIVRNAAVGAEPGRTGFSTAAGEFNIGKGRVEETGAGEIEMTTVDRETETLQEPVGWIKIDVEGYELEVLRGARRVLERFRPVVLLEFNPGVYRLEAILEAVPWEASCYRVPYDETETLTRLGEGGTEEAMDLLLVPPDRERFFSAAPIVP